MHRYGEGRVIQDKFYACTSYIQFSIKIIGRLFSPDYSSALANVKKKSELGSVGGIESAERICALPKPYFITFQN